MLDTKAAGVPAWSHRFVGQASHLGSPGLAADVGMERKRPRGALRVGTGERERRLRGPRHAGDR